MEKIYVENGKSCTNLVDLLLKNLNVNRGFNRTYYNENLTGVQCEEACRSLSDLLSIANTYFENTTIEDLYEALNEISGLKNISVVVYHCNDIHKDVIDYCIVRYPSYYSKIANIYYVEHNTDDADISTYTVQDVVDYFTNKRKMTTNVYLF